MEIKAAMTGPLSSDQWGQAWTLLNTLPREVEGLNLDRADALWSAMGVLRDAARGVGA
jgi:DNA polymerase-3 subunit delta'